VRWLVWRTVRHAPRRLLLAAVAVALPVATLAATFLFVDDSVRAMTTVALRPQQVEMRALATSLNVDVRKVAKQLDGAPGVVGVDVFGAADVIVSTPGAEGRVTARLFAIDPSYLRHHRWVRTTGDLRGGALLNQTIAAAPGFAGAASVSINLRGDVPPLGLTLPVAGRADVREATTWFGIPAGEVQGDIAVVPRAILVDFDTFAGSILPAIRRAFGGATAVTNPGLSELPPVSLEAHVAIDHRAYPADPNQAVGWSGSLRRVLERRAPGEIIVADNAAEALTEASVDATNAKVLFLLLGIPGVIVAAALGLAAASALAEAHRREDALLRLRGASDTQLVRLAVGQGVVASAIGTALGLVAALAAVSGVLGHAVWRDLPTSRLAVTVAFAIAAGGITTAARLVPLVRAGRRSALVIERRLLPGRWLPAWRRGRLDVVALVVGLAILGGNVLVGGLKPTPVPGQALALSFYVLLAPLALWMGVVLLIVRGLLVLLARSSRPDSPRPLSSWRSTGLRWLGRRPARAAVALILGSLAVAFGAEVVTFVATYRSAKQADARAAFGADLRVIPAADRVQPLPPLGAGVAATTPIRSVPARAGSDRKTIMAIEPGSYHATAIAPHIVQGKGLDALARDRRQVLVSQEIAKDFAVSPGDTLPVTIYPDDLDRSQKLDLRVAGVYRDFPPTEPLSEMVISSRVIPAPAPPPDFYLARVAAGRQPAAVAAALRAGAGNAFGVATVAQRVRVQQRTLTALNLDGLGRIEAGAAGLIAAIGVGVLGAFLVLERRREFALLRTVGAGTGAILTGPATEGAAATLGSLVIGVPVGVGLAMVAVRVLGLFFTLPPPLVTIPAVPLLELSAFVLVVSGSALGLALNRVRRVDVAPVLREP
jgi:putative ABC transport system permease protein